MNNSLGCSFDSAIELNEDDSSFTDSQFEISDNESDNSTHRSGYGFMSGKGDWIKTHCISSPCVHEIDFKDRGKWPRYALLLTKTYPMYKLVEPRLLYDEDSLRDSSTLSVDPWVRTVSKDVLRPLSDGFMCILIDMYLVEHAYPAVFHLILHKLYHGDIPVPAAGPVCLLKEIGIHYAIHYWSRKIRNDSKRIKSGETSRSSSRFTTDIGPLFAVWYHCFRVNEVIGLFSREPMQGEFLEAIERTLDSSEFYVKTVWNIASDMREKSSSGWKLITQ